MGLDEGGDAAARGGLEALLDPGGAEHRDDEEHSVRARGARLGHLQRVDDEVLAENRQRDRVAGGDEVVERPAEGGAVGEHRERRGAGGGVSAGDRGAVQVGAERAAARGAALHLGDDAPAAQRAGERAHGRRRLGARPDLGGAATQRRHLRALAGDDRLQGSETTVAHEATCSAHGTPARRRKPRSRS